MNEITKEIGTLTYENPETVGDRYKRCGLQNVIQHIDIYGKFRASYEEKCKSKMLGKDYAMTSVSWNSGRFSNISDVFGDDKAKCVNNKLSNFSVTTKVSGLYPGHDILSRRSRKCRSPINKSNFRCSAYVTR